MKTDNDVKRSSGNEVNGGSLSQQETEQRLDEEAGGEDVVNFDPSTVSTLPTPDQLAAVLQSGPGEFYQQLASQIQDVGIDGKRLKAFVFSVLPHIPVTVILEHIFYR
jgi:hypothetical protein